VAADAGRNGSSDQISHLPASPGVSGDCKCFAHRGRDFARFAPKAAAPSRRAAGRLKRHAPQIWRQLSLPERHRNAGAEDVMGIVLPLDFDEPLGVAAITFTRSVRVIPGKEVGVSARKRHWLERLTNGSSPLTMLLLLELVRPIGPRCKNLNEHMV